MANPFRRSVAGRTCLATSPDPIEVHLDLLIVRDGWLSSTASSIMQNFMRSQLSTGYLSAQNDSAILSSHLPSP